MTWNVKEKLHKLLLISRGMNIYSIKDLHMIWKPHRKPPQTLKIFPGDKNILYERKLQKILTKPTQTLYLCLEMIMNSTKDIRMAWNYLRNIKQNENPTKYMRVATNPPKSPHLMSGKRTHLEMVVWVGYMSWR